MVPLVAIKEHVTALATLHVPLKEVALIVNNAWTDSVR